MDHIKAANAHLTWVADLWKSLMNGDALDVDAVGRDDLCEMGRWLRGEGRRHSNVDGFVVLENLHHDFHQCAAFTVELAASGQVKAALGRLDGGGECEVLSQRLLFTCTEFFHQIDSK